MSLADEIARCDREIEAAESYQGERGVASQPKRELAYLFGLWTSGHPDRRGIALAIEDWIIQDAVEELGRG